MSNPTIAARSPSVQEMQPGTYYWCACGGSKKQPFCDGSHAGTTFQPLKIEIAAAQKTAWCMCKHSKKGAFCDGTHRTLPV